MRSLLLTLLISITPLFIAGQQKADFRSPLDIPLVLSGNFGELRSNHFHSGLDFKTQGVSGHKIYAVESGYISRINIQPGGYGKAIYIDHPNGYTTVYGHVSTFNPRIEKYIKDIQYRRKTHTINLYLEPGELVVGKGEIVALSGNTGSSSGPHLHFEIRRTAGQIPLNGLFFDFPIRDNIPPEITRLAVYPVRDGSHVQNSDAPQIFIPNKGEDGYAISAKEPIRVFGEIGFGIEVYDYLNGARNRCGVYSIELLADGRRYYYSEMNEFSFGESRFINAHIDYAQKYHSRSSIQRMYKLPYNELNIYKQMENGGLVEILDTVTREITIIVADSYGNTSVLKFPVRGTGAQPIMKVKKSYPGKTLPYNAPSGFSDRNLKLTFPEYCFYEDVQFSYTRTNGKQGLLSDIFHLHRESTPVHKSFGIDISMSGTPEKYHDQLCIVKIEDDGKLTYAGGKYSNGVLSESLRNFGRYAVAVDTLSPIIRPLNLQHGADLTQLPGIRFHVDDDLSGIKTYNGYLDGEWILFEYDPKNNLLLHEFDDRVPILRKNRDLELHIEDAKGNMSIYSITFFR
jgi:hypothetical protein